MSASAPILDLRPDDLDIVCNVLRQHVPDREVLAFGSRATWTAKEYSDLDLAILGDEPLPLRVSSALTEAFSESDLPFKVDLVDWASIDRSFRKIIRRDGLTVHIPVADSEAVDAVRRSSSSTNEWCEFNLGKLATVKGGKRLPKGSSLVEYRTNYPYIRTRDISGHKISVNDLLYVPESVFPSIKNYIVNKQDIIVSIVGTIGLCAIVPDVLDKASLTENCAKLVDLDEEKIDRMFLYFFLVSPNGQEAIEQRIVGSTQPKLPLYNIKEVPILVPPLSIQQSIAAILSSLDEKIDLNRRMNETLEAMARAIFKDWFVDFGPTRAKAEGRAPYLAPELWDLFPDALDDQGKPVGWKLGSLGDVATVKSGKRPPAKLKVPDGAHEVPVYGGNGVSWYTNKALYDPPFLITGRVGTLGTVFRVYDRVWISDNALCCFPTKREYFELLFFHLKSLNYESLNSGSTQPLLTQTALMAQKVVIGEQSIRDAFSSRIRPLFSRIVQNTRENQILISVRDLLLPKLMSGEIRLREAEQASEAVT